jgi:hypothetical protein
VSDSKFHLNHFGLLDEAISQLHESIDLLEKARCGLAVVRAEIG